MSLSSGSLDPKCAVPSISNIVMSLVQPLSTLTLTPEEQAQLSTIHRPPLPTPVTVKKWGSEGGKGANWGEPRLMEIVLECFEKSKKPEMCDDINHLYNEHQGLLEKAWKQYKKELELGLRYRNKALTYGQPLTVDGMKRKLYQWVKKPDFRVRLVELGYLKA